MEIGPDLWHMWGFPNTSIILYEVSSLEKQKPQNPNALDSDKKERQAMQEQQVRSLFVSRIRNKHGTRDHTKVESHNNGFLNKLERCYPTYIQCIIFHKLKNMLKTLLNPKQSMQYQTC
jgi:hypothetical protein